MQNERSGKIKKIIGVSHKQLLCVSSTEETMWSYVKNLTYLVKFMSVYTNCPTQTNAKLWLSGVGPAKNQTMENLLENIFAAGVKTNRFFRRGSQFEQQQRDLSSEWGKDENNKGLFIQNTFDKKATKIQEYLQKNKCF